MIYEFKYKEGSKTKDGKLWIESEELFIELDGVINQINLNEIEQLGIGNSGFSVFKKTLLSLYYKENNSLFIKFDLINDVNEIESSEVGAIFRIIRENITNPNFVQPPIYERDGNDYWYVDKEKLDFLFAFEENE